MPRTPTPELLAAVPLFAALTPAEMCALAAAARVCDFARGQGIFQEGEPVLGLYVLLDGLVRIYHNTLEGKELVLHVIRPQSPFGEVPVFKDAATPETSVWPASAAALETSTALLIPTIPLFTLLRGNANWALSLLAALAQRLYMFTRKMCAQAEREAPQRLAAYLLHRSRLEGNATELTLSLGRETLASLLGAARETLSRTLGKLARSGAISVRGRRVSIRDAQLLQALAEGTHPPDQALSKKPFSGGEGGNF